jgi:hypothetical protein
MDIQGISLSTSSMDVQDVSLSAASSVDMEGVPVSTTNNVNVQVVSQSIAYSLDVQGVCIFCHLCKVFFIAGLGCALTFTSEAKFEIEAKISFREKKA